MMNVCFNSDGSSNRGYIWEKNKPKECEKCGKKTDELYCTPIGCCDWRCRECQILLRQSIPDCKEQMDGRGDCFSYPIAPEGYIDPPLSERCPYMFRRNIFGKLVLKKEYECYGD